MGFVMGHGYRTGRAVLFVRYLLRLSAHLAWQPCAHNEFVPVVPTAAAQADLQAQHGWREDRWRCKTFNWPDWPVGRLTVTLRHVCANLTVLVCRRVSVRRLSFYEGSAFLRQTKRVAGMQART